MSSSIPLRGIFFDLDDTLIGYSEAERCALAAGCKVAARAYPGLSEERLSGAIYAAYLTHFAYGTPGFTDLGVLSVDSLRRRITTEALALIGIEDQLLLERMLHVYAEVERKALCAFPETAETLSRLRPYFRLGVITNGPSAMQRAKLSALALEGSFDEIVVDTEFGHPKPDPRIFRHAAHRVHLDPEEILFVGNSLEDDVAGARASGCVSAWINREGANVVASSGQVPDFTIRRLSDVLQLPPIRSRISGMAPSYQ